MHGFLELSHEDSEQFELALIGIQFTQTCPRYVGFVVRTVALVEWTFIIIAGFVRSAIGSFSLAAQSITYSSDVVLWLQILYFLWALTSFNFYFKPRFETFKWLFIQVFLFWPLVALLSLWKITSLPYSLVQYQELFWVDFPFLHSAAFRFI